MQKKTSIFVKSRIIIAQLNVQFNSDLYNSEESSGPLLKQDSLSSTANIEDSDAPILTIKQQCLCYHKSHDSRWALVGSEKHAASTIICVLISSCSDICSNLCKMDNGLPSPSDNRKYHYKRAPQKHTSDTPSIKLKIKFPVHPMYHEDVQHKCKS